METHARVRTAQHRTALYCIDCRSTRSFIVGAFLTNSNSQAGLPIANGRQLHFGQASDTTRFETDLPYAIAIAAAASQLSNVFFKGRLVKTYIFTYTVQIIL